VEEEGRGGGCQTSKLSGVGASSCVLRVCVHKLCVCVCGDYPVHTQHTGVPSLLLHVQQKQCPVPNIKSKKVKQLLECLYHYSWLPSSYCIRVMSFVNVLFLF
jgi:hypothetical protein